MTPEQAPSEIQQLPEKPTRMQLREFLTANPLDPAVDDWIGRLLKNLALSAQTDGKGGFTEKQAFGLLRWALEAVVHEALLLLTLNGEVSVSVGKDGEPLFKAWSAERIAKAQAYLAFRKPSEAVVPSEAPLLPPEPSKAALAPPEPLPVLPEESHRESCASLVGTVLEEHSSSAKPEKPPVKKSQWSATKKSAQVFEPRKARPSKPQPPIVSRPVLPSIPSPSSLPDVKKWDGKLRHLDEDVPLVKRSK